MDGCNGVVYPMAGERGGLRTGGRKVVVVVVLL